MAFDAQKHIRDNTNELHDFLKDLRDWERTMKERDKNLKSQAHHEEPSSLPPIRGGVPRIPSHSNQQSSSKQLSKEETNFKSKGQASRTTQMAVPKIQGSTAAGHTCDFFRDRWDKFDVEVALREADKDTTVKPPSQKAAGKKDEFRSKVDVKKQELRQPAGHTTSSEKQALMGHYESVDRLSSALGLPDFVPNATSEKELGNEYFKEKKFVHAIECYSRSIALQPSAVAYANRAMAYIKIRRHEHAEADCSEAIELDDRYVKAYSRRGTARKEMGKYLAAVEDFEFALRLEPENKELKKQYLEARALCEKNAGVKLSEKKVSLPIEEVKVPTSSKTIVEAGTKIQNILDGGQKMVIDSGTGPGSTVDKATKGFLTAKTEATVAKLDVLTKQQESLVSAQAAAAQAAASAMAALSQKITAPKTSYEFEAAWKSFLGDRGAQAELLKVMDPINLPKVFKDSLNAQLLADIIRTLELFYPDHANVAVDILENLTKVGRFSMTIMCLTSKDKAALSKLWDEVFSSNQVSAQIRNSLTTLRPKYRL